MEKAYFLAGVQIPSSKGKLRRRMLFWCLNGCSAMRSCLFVKDRESQCFCDDLSNSERTENM